MTLPHDQQPLTREGIIYLDPADSRDFLHWREGSGGTVEIFDIQVDSERRQGKGRKLVEMLLDQLDPLTRVFAITRIDNEIAAQFYEALQFNAVSPLRRFYGTGKAVDALLYTRKAAGPV